MQHTIIVSEAQMEMLHSLIADKMQDQRHWACNHLSSGSVADAMRCAAMVDDLRPLYAVTNLTAKQAIADITGQPIKTYHVAKGQI